MNLAQAVRRALKQTAMMTVMSVSDLSLVVAIGGLAVAALGIFVPRSTAKIQARSAALLAERAWFREHRLTAYIETSSFLTDLQIWRDGTGQSIQQARLRVRLPQNCSASPLPTRAPGSADMLRVLDWGTDVDIATALDLAERCRKRLMVGVATPAVHKNYLEDTSKLLEELDGRITRCRVGMTTRLGPESAPRRWRRAFGE